MHESILSSVFRSFLMKLFGMIGLFLGLIPFLFLFLGLMNTSQFEPEVTPQFKVEVVSNAKGIRKILSKTAPVILKINIEGVIGDKNLSANDIKQMFVESNEGVLEGRPIKAIFITINTPGGGAIDSESIYHLLSLYKKEHKVPVYGFVNGLCASGGMFVAAACDKIYSSNASIIGSVGVITSPYFNFADTLEKIGAKALVLSAGTDKNALGQFTPWKEGETDNLKDLIQFYYTQFVDTIAKERPLLTTEKLITEYGARVYPASLAKEYGYIDEIANSEEEVLKKLVEEIGILDDYYQVVTLKNTKWLFSLFQEETFFNKGKIEHSFNLTSLPKNLENQLLYLYLPSQGI